MVLDHLLKNALLVEPGIGVTAGSIGIKDGVIAAVLAEGMDLPAVETTDCRGCWVMPGLIDPHVHFGFGSPETDFLTESRSAALGGVTTVLSFHRSKDLRESVIPACDLAARQSCIDFGFHFGITSRLHVETLAECSRRFGVSSYKIYLMYKGQAGLSQGFTEIDDSLLFTAMEETAKIPGAVLGVHCENIEVIPVLRDRLRRQGRDDLAAWDEQSPDFLEAENVHRTCYFAEKTGCPVNIVHLSSKEALEEVRRHRNRPAHAPIYVETCPQYLTLTHGSPAGALAKVNPAVRSARDVDALWEGVLDGSVTTIGSDHVPRKRSTKAGGIWGASNGFPGTGTILPLMIHEGYHNRRVPIERLAALLSANAARLYHLHDKGTLGVGTNADLVVIDPTHERVVDASTLESYADYSPYEGMTLKGWPIMTLSRGRKIAEHGAITPQALNHPAGRYLPRLKSDP